MVRQPLPPERGRGTGDGRLSGPEGIPQVPRDVRPAGCDEVLGHGQGRPDGRPALRARRQAAHRGHRPPEHQAHGDLRRRVRGRGQGLHEAQQRCRQAFLRMAELHPHAPVYPYEARERRAGGPLAVAVPRYDDRSRQERRRRLEVSRRSGHRRQHVRHVLDRQRSAHEFLAGRRHDRSAARRTPTGRARSACP